MTSNDTLISEQITSAAKLDFQLFEHITNYVNQNSFVKLEAALTQMVYSQFEAHYQQASEVEKLAIRKQIERYVPNRQKLKAYLDGHPICYRCTNTLANFFQVPYVLINHDPTRDISPNSAQNP
jgi:hypothetical protein